MKKVIIFGCGEAGKKAFHLLNPVSSVIAFADNNKALHGKQVLDCPVIAPETIKSQDYHSIVIASQYQDEIYKQLCESGIPKNRMEILPHYARHFGITQPLSEDPRSKFSFNFNYLTTGREEVFKALLLGLEYVYGMGVSGNIAEFGTMTGATASALAQGMWIYSKHHSYSDNKHGIAPRKLFLFDSFQGLPEANNEIDSNCPHATSNIWFAGACKGLTALQLMTACARFLEPRSIKIFEGWFKDTLTSLRPEEKFALVHLDCDFYESTIQVLDYLFKHNLFSDGCALFFDDWNCNRSSPKFGNRKAWQECIKRYNPTFSDCGGYGVAGHKFIIHTEV